MILSFPDTPSGVARVHFEIERVDYGAPEASGRQGGVQAGWPLWMATFELDRIDPVSGDLWKAFMARLRGRIRRFYAGDTTRMFPRRAANGFAGMVRAGGGAFNGSALGWAQNIDADGNAIVALTGLPANFALEAGDLIGWKWDAAGAPAASYERRTMARVVAPAVASGGGAASVMIEPPLDTRVVPVGAVAHLDRPMCVMQQVPEKTSLGSTGAGSALSGGALTCIQDLRP